MLSEFVRSYTEGVIKNTLISQRTEINLASDKFGVSLVVLHVYINYFLNQCVKWSVTIWRDRAITGKIQKEEKCFIHVQIRTPFVTGRRGPPVHGRLTLD